MKTRIQTTKQGFTLVELITAMAITSILVLIIMQLTNQGIALWRTVQEDVSTTSSSRVALQTIARDLESFQMRGGTNKYQWLFAKTDSQVQGAGIPKGLKIPKSVQCAFFACAPDRNPSVSSSTFLRSNYREARAHNTDTQGDVNAIGYRLMYRDQILNVSGGGKDDGAFPLFSLYRQVVSPREAFENLMGKEDLESAYVPYESTESENFLCENIVELSMIFNIEYVAQKGKGKSSSVEYDTISVPVVSSRGTGKKVAVYGDRIVADGQTLPHGRIVSANISITVLTEAGVAFVEQVRKGRRRAPANAADFFNRYTRSFSRSVLLPQPL